MKRKFTARPDTMSDQQVEASTQKRRFTVSPIIASSEDDTYYLTDEKGNKYPVPDDVIKEVLHAGVLDAADNCDNEQDAASEALDYFSRWVASEASKELGLPGNVRLCAPDEGELKDAFYDIAFDLAKEILLAYLSGV